MTNSAIRTNNINASTIKDKKGPSTRISPSTWKSLLTRIIDVNEFVQYARKYAVNYLVKPDGLLMDINELKTAEK